MLLLDGAIVVVIGVGWLLCGLVDAIDVRSVGDTVLLRVSSPSLMLFMLSGD